MQIKSLFLVVASSLVGVTLASPWYPTTVTKTITVTPPPATVTTISQCNTGSIQCCNSIQNANSADVANLSGLLGIVLQGVDALVGLGCTPISVVGVASGPSCSAQAACCTGDQFNGLINIGCTPISL